MSCPDVEMIISNPGFLIAVGSQAFAALLSIVICTIVIRQSKNLYFHINCKILLLTMLLLYIVHSVLIMILQTLQLIRYLTISDACDVGLSPLFCLYLRTPMSVCMISFTLFQFMLVVERILAIWKHRNYSSCGPQFGYASLVLCITVAIGAMFWILENADLTEKQFICSSASARNRDRLEKSCFAMCAINMTSLLALLILFLFNKSAEKRKIFDLRSSYQVRENADVLKIMLPLSIFETFCYGVFSFYGGFIYMLHNQLSVATSRILLTAGYVVPYYTLISPLIFSYLIRRSRRMRIAELEKMTNRKDEAESYIQMCTEMWNRPVLKKN